MDMDGTAFAISFRLFSLTRQANSLLTISTMEAAAVGLQYTIIGIPINPKGKYKHEVEHERRGSAMCVAKIFEGKMAQADIVLDTAQVSRESFSFERRARADSPGAAQFHELESPMEVACTVM